MYTVADLMTPDPVVLDVNDDLNLADEIFHLGRLRHLPVVKDGRLVGLVSQRDFVHALVKRGEHKGRTALAGEVMTADVVTVQPSTSLRKALRVMIRNKFGCLPVVDDSHKLVGIMTESDAARFAAKLVEELDQVERGAVNFSA
jgi:CBS domain-containing protein